MIYQEIPSVSTTLDAQAGNVFSIDFIIQLVDVIGSTYQWPQNKHRFKKITTILIYFCTPACVSFTIITSKIIQLMSSTPHDIQNVKT